ncbi:MAG: hypothetical protein QM758_12100 [Armatimonas sp.]
MQQDTKFILKKYHPYSPNIPIDLIYNLSESDIQALLTNNKISTYDSICFLDHRNQFELNNKESRDLLSDDIWIPICTAIKNNNSIIKLTKRKEIKKRIISTITPKKLQKSQENETNTEQSTNSIDIKESNISKKPRVLNIQDNRNILVIVNDYLNCRAIYNGCNFHFTPLPSTPSANSPLTLSSIGQYLRRNTSSEITEHEIGKIDFTHEVTQSIPPKHDSTFNQTYSIEEYKSLRNEIIERIKIQTQLKTISAAALGAILITAINLKIYEISLAYNLICCSLCLSWSFNNYRIRNLSYYLECKEMLVFGSDANPDPNPYTQGWETYFKKIDDLNRVLKIKPRLVEPIAFFVGSQAAVFIITLIAKSSIIKNDDNPSNLFYQWININDISLAMEGMTILTILCLFISFLWIFQSESTRGRRITIQIWIYKNRLIYLSLSFLLIILSILFFFSTTINPFLIFFWTMLTGFSISKRNTSFDFTRQEIRTGKIIVSCIFIILFMILGAFFRFHGLIEYNNPFTSRSKIKQIKMQIITETNNMNNNETEFKYKIKQMESELLLLKSTTGQSINK